MRPGRSFWCACIVLSAVLLGAELSFLALPGIQQDEALFIKPFLHAESALYSVTVGTFRVPVMAMDYVGCLKTWFFWPVFRIWRSGVWSVRLPMCFLSMGTLLLFAGLVRKAANAPVAVA